MITSKWTSTGWAIFFIWFEFKVASNDSFHLPSQRLDIAKLQCQCHKIFISSGIFHESPEALTTAEAAFHICLKKFAKRYSQFKLHPHCQQHQWSHLFADLLVHFSWWHWWKFSAVVNDTSGQRHLWSTTPVVNNTGSQQHRWSTTLVVNNKGGQQHRWSTTLVVNNTGGEQRQHHESYTWNYTLSKKSIYKFNLQLNSA